MSYRGQFRGPQNPGMPPGGGYPPSGRSFSLFEGGHSPLGRGNFSPQGGYSPSGGGYFPQGISTKQLTLKPPQGISGNAVATIGGDNVFSLIAHLPPPHTLNPHSPAVYAAYLVDNSGKNGFYAGTLTPAGNGVYQARFRSPVPLVHYNKVLVSLEDPQNIGQAPMGPIVLKNEEGLLSGLSALEPLKRAGGKLWEKAGNFIRGRFGGQAQYQQAPGQNGHNQPPVQNQVPSQEYGRIPGQQSPTPAPTPTTSTQASVEAQNPLPNPNPAPAAQPGYQNPSSVPQGNPETKTPEQ